MNPQAIANSVCFYPVTPSPCHIVIPSSGTKLPVARITQTRHNEANVVEMRINLGNVNWHVWVSVLQGSNAFWRSQQADKFDALGAPFLQNVDGGDG